MEAGECRPWSRKENSELSGGWYLRRQEYARLGGRDQVSGQLIAHKPVKGTFRIVVQMEYKHAKYLLLHHRILMQYDIESSTVFYRKWCSRCVVRLKGVRLHVRLCFATERFMRSQFPITRGVGWISVRK